ncbi:MAG: hypothetical protein ACPGUV_13485 [Polyangiales bacterium]
MATHDMARRQIEIVLNFIEDAHSGVPYAPEHWRSDGRMYSAMDDCAAPVDGHPGVTAYRHRRQETFIAAHGAIEIRDVSNGAILCRKSGKNGKGVWT